MDTTTLILIMGPVLAGVLLLKPRDLFPMLVNLLLIVGGTLALLWLMTNQKEAQAIQSWVTTTGADWGMKALILIACQPLLFIAARWMAKRLPPASTKTLSPEVKGILKAAVFAADKHRDQRRKDQFASPYINHPLGVANILVNEVDDITDYVAIKAALLHDTIEDTETSPQEIEDSFGPAVLKVVLEKSDDKSLPKEVRKLFQIQDASSLSRSAKLVAIADKICNLRDMANSPPFDWPLDRQIEYFDWCKEVVDQMRGVHSGLEALFDQAYAMRPREMD